MTEHEIIEILKECDSYIFLPEEYIDNLGEWIKEKLKEVNENG